MFLEEIVAQPESVERTAALVAWVQGLFQEHDPPVLVGGAAVELYTKGAYTTGDLDFVGDTTREVERALAAAGFRRQGRHWRHEQGEVFLEFPGRVLDDGEEPVLLSVGELKVHVLAPEALLVDRLAAWQFWRSEQDAVNALLITRSTDLQMEVVRTLAKRRQVVPALESLRRARKRWGEVEPSPRELETWARTIPSE